jgi:hypothetical protein
LSKGSVPTLRSEYHRTAVAAKATPTASEREAVTATAIRRIRSDV